MPIKKPKLCVDCGKPFKDSHGFRCKKCMEKYRKLRYDVDYIKERNKRYRERLENETD